MNGPERSEKRHEPMPDPYQEFLDPARMRLWRDKSARVRMTIEGDRSFLDVKVVRAFPLSDPDCYIALLNGGEQDRVIGMVKDTSKMEPASQETAAESLRHHYFMPVIRRIHTMKEQFGVIYCDVETDRGRREFVCRGVRDAVEDMGDGEYIIPDVDGNRYHIPDIEALDLRSRRLLERIA